MDEGMALRRLKRGSVKRIRRLGLGSCIALSALARGRVTYRV